MERSSLKVCILGSETVGKTSFLAGLMVLGEPNRQSGFTINGENTETKEFLHNRQTEFVEYRQFPPSTSATESLLVSVVFDRRHIQISIVEFPGEDFRAAVNTGQLAKMPRFHEQLLGAGVLLLMIDPTIEGQAKDEMDPTAKHHIQDRQRALLDSVIEVCRGNVNPPDLAIVVTKADRYAEVFQEGRAADFLRAKLPEMMKRIEAELPRKPKYFAISSVGSVEEEVLPNGQYRIRPAAEINPRGYDELFQWMIRRKQARDRAPRRRLALRAAALLAVVAATAIIAVLGNRSHYSALLANQNVPIQDLLEIPRSGILAPSATQFADRANQELDGIDNRLKNRPSRDDLRQSVLPLFQSVKALCKGTPAEARCDAREHAARTQLEDLWASALAKRGMPADSNFEAYESEVSEFSVEFPGSPHKERLQEQLDKARQQVDRQLRNAITSIRAGDFIGQESQFMRRKADAMIKYASNPRCGLAKNQRADIQRAAYLAGLMADCGAYRVKCQSLGPLADERRTTVEIRSRKTGLSDWQVAAVWENDVPASTIHWDDERILDWRPGEALQVEIKIYRWRTSPAKPFTDPGYVWLPNKEPSANTLALKTVAGSQKLNAGDVSGSWVVTDWRETVNGAELKMEVKTNTAKGETISSDDWELLDRYVDPGTGW